MKTLLVLSLMIAFCSSARADELGRFRRFREAPFIQCADQGGLRIEHRHIPQVLDDSAGVISIGDNLWSFTRAKLADENDKSVVWKLQTSNEDFPGTGKFAVVKILKSKSGVSVKIKSGDGGALQFKNCF